MTILQTADLKKYYGQGTNLTKALDGVDLSVEQGEFLAVVGTSGSGKSTLLHMMGGLDTPTSGSIKVRGKELAEMNDEQLTIFLRGLFGCVAGLLPFAPTRWRQRTFGIRFATSS